MTSLSRLPGLLLTALVFAVNPVRAYDIPGFPPDEVLVYKETSDSSGNPVSLDLHFFYPDGHQAADRRAAIVFFFGGGWNSGSPGQFHPHCDYLASRGMVAISAEYRIRNTHGTTPQECVKDGKSAVRWLRKNAATLGIDPERIAAGGGSAGGHVAAAAGTLARFEEAGEDTAIRSRPDALVLFNPVYDNGPGGYGHGRVSAYWEDFSPLHNIDDTTPPAIVFLGTNDALIPVTTAETFQELMQAEQVRSDLHLYHGQPHSFFNYDIPDDDRGPYHGYQDTLLKTDQFLVSLGYLPEYPATPEPLANWVTIFGEESLLEGSEVTASPRLINADAQAIAAGFDEVILENADFMELAGSVTFDRELPGSAFRFGLFGGGSPVSTGNGTGYRGVWSAAPATVDTSIVAGDGSGSSHPFESAGATTLAPLPGASQALAADTPLNFTLRIARNGNEYDLSTTLEDGVGYHSSQNLLNQPLPSVGFDRAAFLATSDLAGAEMRFSDLTLASGRLLSWRPPEEPEQPEVNLDRVITYLDAVEGPEGNTRATALPSSDLSWLVDPGTSSANQTQWNKRLFGNGETVFQGLHALPDTLPELTTRISGLDDGDYQIWAFYWDQVENDSQNWILSAGLESGELESYSSPGEPAVSGATTNPVVNANSLNFSNEILTVDGGGLRHLLGIPLGTVTVTGGSAVDIFVDNLLGNGSRNRVWFDGVGYAPVNDFSAWISQFEVGPQTGLSDDPDRDGKPNAIENIFGTHPGLSENQGLRLTATTSPERVSFTHPSTDTPADDLLARYQWSRDLEQFYDDGASDDEGLVITFSSEPDTPLAGVTTVTASTSGSPLPQPFFLRIAVSQ